MEDKKSIFHFEYESPFGNWISTDENKELIDEDDLKLYEFLNQTFFEPENIPNYNEITKDTMVVWINSKNSLFRNKKLITGLKMIRLSVDVENEKSKCAYWLKGGYHFLDVPHKYLSSSHVQLSRKSWLVFQNEVEHLLERLNFYFISIYGFTLDELMTDVSEKGVENKVREFGVMINQFLYKGFISKIRRKDLLSKLIAFEKDFLVDINNPVKTINFILESILDVYDPKDNTGKVSETILVVPITYKWLEKYESELTSFSKDGTDFENLDENGVTKNNIVMINNLYLSFTQDNAYSGEVIDVSYDSFGYFMKWLTIDLPNDIQKSKNIEFIESDFSKWIMDLSRNYDLKKLKSIIVFGKETWFHKSTDCFSESVGLGGAMGIFKPPAIMVVIVHELTMAENNYLKFPDLQTINGVYPYDTHIAQDHSKNARILAKNDFGKVKSDSEYMDDLYQSTALYQAVTTSIILRYILS